MQVLLLYNKQNDDKGDKGSGRVIIALARKITRIVFVMLSKRESFNPELMRCEETIQQTA